VNDRSAVVLAVSPGDRAAAVAIDGHLAGAAIDRAGGSGQSSNGAAAAALRAAGVTSEQVHVVSVVGSAAGPLPGVSNGIDPVLPRVLDRATRRHVTPVEAHLAQAAAVAPEGAVLLVANETDPDQSVVAQHCATRIIGIEPRPDIGSAVALAGRLAADIGVPGTHLAMELEVAAQTGSPGYLEDFTSILQLRDGATHVDWARYQAFMDRVAEGTPADLRRRDSLHNHVQRRRTDLAASLLDRLVEVLARVLEGLSEQSRAGAVALSGSLFTDAHFNGRLATALNGAVSIAPVPEGAGAVLGAALLAGGGVIEPITHLALGPTVTEHDIKPVLENCRLEFLYEPDWPRLMSRVSAMLSSGKLIAWFQGPLEFGPRSLGSRSILCDPSNRYARDNVNTFLRQRPLDDPLGLSIPACRARECLVRDLDSPFMLVGAEVQPQWRSRVVAALDRRHRCAVHTVRAAASPALHDLLELHYARTGVPGLINVPLSTTPHTLVADAREAVRSTFGSAIDVLVMGRFLISKDYWLLRSTAVV
jgi:predicted NodU family carbamoyl transferase